MATKTFTEANGCTFQWKIGNISLCLLQKGETIVSPSFIADALEGTKWSLWLYPMGYLSENNVDMYLIRCRDCSGPPKIDINYLMVLLDKDGKCLTERTTVNPNFGKYVSIHKKFARENIFKTEREAFLPEDTLTVQCSLWKRGETLFKSKLISALTVFKVNHRSFVWKIDEFSSLKLGLRNKFKDDLINFDIVLSEGLDFETKLVLDDVSLDESIKYFSFKTSIIDSEGKKGDWGRHEYFANDLKRGVSCTLLFTKKLTESKGRYLPNDVLSLKCEYVYATGTVLSQFCSCGAISPNVTKIDVEENVKHFVEPKDLQLTTPVLLNDLRSMYVDGIFSDTNLRTPTKTFPAHKNILGARSPVFRRMFSNDMKEKNSGYVDITDLEDHAVHRMLLYLYTDSLADLQLDKACKLYAAAEKYEIVSLRKRCSSFLKDNLCSTKACDILVLADLHQDDDLKSAVQDFILRHGKQVFDSQEWKTLMASNIQLAADVMYRKVLSG